MNASDLPEDMAMRMAMVQQNAAVSMIKKNAQAEQAIANMLDQSIRNVPRSAIRGSNVNIQA